MSDRLDDVDDLQVSAGSGKADFDALYDRPDPRDLARALSELDYEIPQQALPVFQTLLAARAGGGVPDEDADQAGGAEPPRQRVVDLCCSYGINAALLRHDVDVDELMGRWCALDGLGVEELARADEEFFASRRRPDAPRVDGLDVAGNAVGYAQRVGLLDAGWVEDLEHREPSAGLHAELAGTDLVTITGGVGYVTERTFDRVLAPGDDVPWVAAFVLRMYPYDGIEGVLATHGLVTERLADRAFPQRRFASDDEQQAAMKDVVARGLNPAGLEDSGRYFTDLFVSRPAADVERAPLPELLAGVAGR